MRPNVGQDPEEEEDKADDDEDPRAVVAGAAFAKHPRELITDCGLEAFWLRNIVSAQSNPPPPRFNTVRIFTAIAVWGKN